jgi:hypothetical protein
MLLMLVETVGGVSRENGSRQKRWRRTRLSRLQVTVGAVAVNSILAPFIFQQLLISN